MKIGFLFPGQGSQYVGMGKDLYEKYEEVRNIYDRVENLTGVDVKKISFEGPEEELNQTKNTQLCILTMSLAILEILNKNGVKEILQLKLNDEDQAKFDHSCNIIKENIKNEINLLLNE